MRLSHFLSSKPSHSGPFGGIDSDQSDEAHQVLHTHVLSDETPGAIYILSTRESKKDIILSNLIARKTMEWTPGDGNTLTPFSVDEKQYNALKGQLLLKEEAYIKKHSPIVIYLEDSVEDIEEKLQTQVIYPENDTAFISKYPPKDYIINYSSLE